jgi:hypothetical protein
MTSEKQLPKIKCKRVRPENTVKYLYKNDRNIEIYNKELFIFQKIVEINYQPSTGDSNQKVVPKKKWCYNNFNNGNKSIHFKIFKPLFKTTDLHRISVEIKIPNLLFHHP